MATLKVTNIKNESFAGDQLYFKSDGYLGIGTTSPGHKLVISQTNSGGIAAIHLPVDESTILGPNANTYLKMGGNVVLGANGQLDFTTSGTSKLTIKNNGQVAIGSSSTDTSALISIIKDTTEVLADNEPLYNNASPAFLTIYNSNNTGTGEEAGINLVPAGNANGAISIYGKKTGSYSGDLIFRFRSGASTSAERMRITSGGNVGIGTISPDNNLHVKGTGTDILKVESTDDGAQGTNLILQHSPGAGNMADNDVISLLQFAGVDDSNNATTYSSIRAVATDVSNNSESGSITFHTRNANVFAERFSIASDGKTFIERTVTSTAEVHPALQIETTSTGTENSSFATGIDFFQDGIHKKRLAVTKGNSGTGGGDWAFYKDQGTTVHTYMTADGNMNIVDGDLKIGTGGHGIDFSAQTQSSSTTDDEILDHYEKGKWTPELKKNSNANATPTIYHGRYVRVGKMVWLSCYMYWSSGSNSEGTSGSWTLHGLPFSLQDDNPGTCRIYQYASTGYFAIDDDYSMQYGHDNRWQANSNTALTLYTDISSADQAWTTGVMQMSMTGTFMIHE